MTDRLPHVLARVSARLFNVPLLLAPDTAVAIASNLAARFGVEPMRTPKSATFDGEPGEGGAYAIVGGVAIVSVRGELVNRGSWLNAASGLVSYEALSSNLRQAAADPLVRAIVLDMDSPGGEATGCAECAAVIREVAGKKRVTAVVNGLAASAAYWLASAASEIVVTPSSVVGSIGVVWLHLDYSKALNEAGVKPTLLHAGAFKVDGNQMEPLDPGARKRIEGMIERYYSLFTGDVGKHRPKLGEAGARKTEAGVLLGKDGVDGGLADRVGTIDNVLTGFRQQIAKPPPSIKLPAMRTTAPSTIGEANDPGAPERARIGAILRSDAAKGRKSLAQHLAFNTSFTSSEAIAALTMSPVGAQVRPTLPRSAAHRYGSVTFKSAAEANAFSKRLQDELKAEAEARRGARP